VLWAGLHDGGEALAALAGAIDDALARLGFAREERAFSPHVTLGRVRDPRRAPALAEALAAAATRSFGRVAVREATVMRSDLSPRGARYTRLGGGRLAPCEPPDAPRLPSA
jgi:2'-5' RNA ligase